MWKIVTLFIAVGILALTLLPVKAEREVLCKEDQPCFQFMPLVFGFLKPSTATPVPPTATPTKTPRPTNTPTVTPVPTATPTEQPGFVRFAGPPNDMLMICRMICTWFLRFVPANAGTCVGPIVDEVKSTYKGKAFNSFPTGQTPVIGFDTMEDIYSQWEIDIEFIMFQYPIIPGPDPENYHLEIVCKKP